MEKIRNFHVKTELTVEDQIATQKFLQSVHGMKVLAWLRENTPANPFPSQPEHAYVAHSGKMSGYADAIYNLCRVPGSNLTDLNGTIEDELKTDDT